MLFALGLMAVLACVAIGVVIAVSWRRHVSSGAMAWAVVVVLVIAGLVTWMALVLPAYWD